MDVQGVRQGGIWGSKVAFVFAASGSAIGLGSMLSLILPTGLLEKTTRDYFYTKKKSGP